MVFTVPLLRAPPLPINCCVILITGHTLLLRGSLTTVVNKRHIACSVHVISTVAWSPSNGSKQTPYCLQHARHNIKRSALFPNKRNIIISAMREQGVL
jgi:hypothetical protein